MALFDWTDFLETNKSETVSEELFGHVEASICNGIKQGMLLEACHKNNPDIYWIAEITMVCGHLLRIKFLGAVNDFWCDISTTKVHPLGWCGKYDEQIEPPDEINEMYGDKIIDIMKNALLDGLSVSIEALKNKGLSPIDRIKTGMKVEVQNIMDPYKYWIATVCDNIGGRLQLRYDGSDDDLPLFWIFYCNPRLSSFGFVTNKGSPWQFKYPGKLNKFSCKNKLSTQLRQCAEEAIKEPAPPDLFLVNQSNLEVHNFVTGMKLEALDPTDMNSFRAATVTKIYNNYHFLVTLDDEEYDDEKVVWLCDSSHPYIFPIGWSDMHKMTLTPPKTWKEHNFDWDEYLAMTSSVPAPEYCFRSKESNKGFQVNMKLEAVHPLKNEEIHVANIERVVEHLLRVNLLSTGESFWYAQCSDLLFPVGWCDSNNYELHVPDLSKQVEVPVIAPKQKETAPPEQWCERIYFNYKCYAGSSISRNRLSQLPKHMGPGPLTLLLKEVMNKIISASYKPAKLLRDWETEGPPEEGMRLELLKAKLKSNTYHAYVPIATKSEQVTSFCRSVCVKLQACPYLFGPLEFPDQCPENCQQVDKSKFRLTNTEPYVERRGRPKGSFKKKKKTPEKTPEQQSQEMESKVDSNSERSGSTPRSETCQRPDTPDSDYKRKPDHNRGKKNLTNHWEAKAKRSKTFTDSENDSVSSNSRTRQISDVSDTEEPELKKLRCSSKGPQPTDNKLFETIVNMTLVKRELKLSTNPIEWSVDDVYSYLCSTEDCKLVADRIRKEEIDGEAFIMLNFPVLKEFLHMKKEFALKLCKHIAVWKWHYLVNYDNV